jgi:hypothetical protein
MKQLLLAAGLGLSLSGCMTAAGWSEAPLDDRYYAQAAPVGWWGQDVASVDVFYGSLAAYGNWGTHARYGRVFLPAGVGPGWQPYSRGYWRQDPRFGRVFVSSDPWGWATYHYGRWGRDPGFGWFWVPDRHFGPSWVDWRSGGGYASWSPLPPFGWSNWGYGWGNDWWVHAPGAWVYRPGLNNHVRRGRHDWDGRRDWDGQRDRDRDRDRYRDSDRETVDRTRPGESPMAGFVRNRVEPDGADLRTRQEPPAGWTSSRAGTRPADGNPAAAGFVRSRVQPVDAPGLRRAPRQAAVAPPRAAPAQAAVASPPTQAAVAPSPPRPARAERAQPSYQRAEPSYQRSRPERSGGRDVPQRVADD